MTRRFMHIATTGLGYGVDEILEIAILDEDGSALLDTLVRPRHVSTWEDATRHHGITPAMVEDAPPASLVQISPHLAGAEIVCFGAEFVQGFLGPFLAMQADSFHCLAYRWREFVALSTESGFSAYKLSDAARIVGFSQPISGRARVAAEASRAILRALEEPERTGALVREAAAQRRAERERELAELRRMRARRETRATMLLEELRGLVHAWADATPRVRELVDELHADGRNMELGRMLQRPDAPAELDEDIPF